MIRHWIEAMRFRTLPVSIAGVIAGTGCAILLDSFKAIPALLCLLFAILAQIASNFGNEYYDFKNGIDKKGRAGFRRGVTEGEISPKAMKYATFITLGIAAAVGCTMLIYGPWWLIIAGLLIICFALAYSAGPYPLSHHGLGDIAVMIFFGIVPVVLTWYLQTSSWESVGLVIETSLAIGLLAANVLVVNNYRDMEDDAAVGKRTTVVIFGRKAMSTVYLLSGFIGMAVMLPVWLTLPVWGLVIPLIYLALHIKTWSTLRRCTGSAINPLLGKTAMNLLIFTLLFAGACLFKSSRMMLYLCISGSIFLALLPNLLWVIGWIACKIAGVSLPYKHFGLCALVLVAAFLLILAYGYYIGRWNVKSTEIEYSHHDIPKAFDGFRIVHISDLQLSTFDDSKERFREFIDEINKHTPDLVCFTGDLVTLGKDEAEPYTDYLKSIKSKYGVLSVLGNHDFMIYGFDKNLNRGAAVKELARYQEEALGWKLLRNESTVIEAEDGSTMTFLGVDNSNFSNQGFRTIHRGDLDKAMDGTEGFRVLLSHDPSHWSAEVIPNTDIPLTLSGHTHSAQIKIFGWTPAKWSFNEIAGRYDKDGQTLYINVGLGCTAPIRLGVNPEVTLITLKSLDTDSI